MERPMRLIGLALALMVPAAAVAQAPPKTEPPVVSHAERGNPNPCETRSTVSQGGGVDVKTPEGKALSQKLAQSNGVICPPPHVDPDMKHPPPGGGIMPVIPPSAVTPHTQAK
jgi:hypothetical protein